MKYRAFLSYSHADSRIARRLHRWLETYRFPARLVGRDTPLGPVPPRLHPIFRDREELPTSADLGGQIQAALAESATLLVICSPRAAASRWVNEEIIAFKRLGRGDRVLCLIVAGEPNASATPGREAEECFPPALRFHLGPDGRPSDVPAEPIAADMRRSGDGPRDAFLKLAAGLAGVGFDDLRRRELQRQVRRAAAVTIASLGLGAAMTGLAVAALLARREAVAQRTVAERERDRAEENFRDARDAVDRFYTKVAEDDLLRAEGLQPLRRDLLEQALGYYRRFLRQRRGDAAFAVDAAVVQGKVATILSVVGDPGEALAAAGEATATLEALHRRDPSERITTALAASVAEEALNLDRLGRTEEALRKNREAIDLRQGLPHGSPGRSAAELQGLWGARGAFEARLARFDDAVRSYERSLAFAAEAAPAKLAPLGVALEEGAAGVVVVGVTAGSPAEAGGLKVGDVVVSAAGIEIPRIDAWPQVRERLEAGVASPVVVARSGERLTLEVVPVLLGDPVAAAARYNLGYLLLWRAGRPEDARPWLESSGDEFRRALLRGGADVAESREGLVRAAAALAACGMQLGDRELHERGTREAARVAEENVQANPSVPAYRRSAGTHGVNLSSLLWARGRLDEAAAACEQAVAHFRRALESGGNLGADRLQLAQALMNLALIRDAQAGPGAAIPIHESALEMARGLDDPANPLGLVAVARLRRNFASSLRKADRLEEAAFHYDEAAAAYDRVMQAAEPGQVPVAILGDEAVQIEPWRAATAARLGDAAAEARVAARFEEACRSRSATDGGAAAVARLRLGAVEAWCEAASRTAPTDAARAARLLDVAATQLRHAEEAAAGIDDLADSVKDARKLLVDTGAAVTKASE